MTAGVSGSRTNAAEAFEPAGKGISHTPLSVISRKVRRPRAGGRYSSTQPVGT
jgi:hypothetical protein